MSGSSKIPTLLQGSWFRNVSRAVFRVLAALGELRFGGPHFSNNYYMYTAPFLDIVTKDDLVKEEEQI
uniref:Uncharacterized protein n=1 Tax=Romanomermis culicivorax TaxID=13658 RepID=A0A915HLW0_ROMCU